MVVCFCLGLVGCCCCSCSCSCYSSSSSCCYASLVQPFQVIPCGALLGGKVRASEGGLCLWARFNIVGAWGAGGETEVQGLEGVKGSGLGSGSGSGSGNGNSAIFLVTRMSTGGCWVGGKRKQEGWRAPSRKLLSTSKKAVVLLW